MTLWLLVFFWGLSLLLLAPRALSWIADRQHQTERTLLKRLEHFHIFLEIAAIRWVLSLVVIFSIILGVGFFRSFVSVLLVAGLGVVGIFIVVRHRTAKRIKVIRYQLPGVVELIATSLRSGLSIRSAFLQVTRQSQQPIQQELAMLERMQRIGIPLDKALSEWSRKLPVEELKLLVFTVAVSTASGGNLSDSLDRLAAAWRQHLILEEKVDALTAQGRLQAWVMAALPLILALALTMLDPVSMQSLWTTTAGHMVMMAVLFLEIAGLFWIQRLVRVDA
jgi:tight adherence protein B